MTSFYRSSPPIYAEMDNLGLLKDLPGRWVGSGFNLISRPFFNQPAGAAPFFLELSATDEILDFKAIGGGVANRGSVGDDIIHGVSYLQQVTDRSAHSGLHIEPGFWLRVPAQFRG